MVLGLRSGAGELELRIDIIHQDPHLLLAPSKLAELAALQMFESVLI